MKFKGKLLVLFVAVVVSLLGFNLIASSSVCLLKIAKEAGYEAIESYRVNCDADTYRIRYIEDKASQFNCPGFY